jgi:hypothetical protein
MRTTLSLDDNLYRLLRERSRREGKTFRQIVNDVLRRGFTGEPGGAEMESFRVEAKHCGFQPGVDLARLNQISDDLDLDVFRCGAGEAGGP